MRKAPNNGAAEKITYLAGRYSEFVGGFPFRRSNQGLSYVGPNFTATVTVPEPSSLALILGGAAISAVINGRRHACR